MLTTAVLAPRSAPVGPGAARGTTLKVLARPNRLLEPMRGRSDSNGLGCRRILHILLARALKILACAIK